MGTERKNLPKVVVVLGPTASGKSDLAVKLALKFNGEVISADSRQVYKGMDIGSGKITQKEMRGIPHHLLDIASPKRRFTAYQYQKKAQKAVSKILKKNKLPIVCGGTAFYINALIDGVEYPKIPPDWELRKKLDKKSNEELFETILKKDKRRAKEIDQKNRRRLIRAVEIIEKTKKPVPVVKKKIIYSPLFLGIKISQKKLDEKIDSRLKRRLSEGMIREVKKLRKNGISWKKLESFGLEYKWTSLYLQEKVSYREAIESLSTDIKKFSKRQMTWWKHDKRIKWIESYKEAEDATRNFL